MMETSDYLLLGLLALVAALLAVLILILLRRNSPKQRTDLPLSTAATFEESDVKADQKAFEESPEADPLETYLHYLERVCQSVERLRD